MDKPKWSPDGGMVYFIADEPGSFFNLWGQRFDQPSGRLQGDPFQISRFADPGEMIAPNPSDWDIAITAKAVVLPIQHATGSVWMLDGVDR